MRQLEYINGISGVTQGGTATLNLPLNRRYHGLKLFPTAMIEGDPVGAAGVFDTPTDDPLVIIRSVKLLVNGTAQIDLPVADMIRLAQIDAGGVAVDDHVPIFFSNPAIATVLGEELTSWDMFGQRTFALQVEFRENIRNPLLETLASFDYFRNRVGNQNVLNIVRRLAYTFSAPAGSHDIVALPKRDPILRIHIAPSVGTISRAEVVADNLKVFEAKKAQNDAYLKDYGIISPYAYSVIFNHEQQLTSPLKVARDLNLRATFSDANSSTFIIETVSNGYGSN